MTLPQEAIIARVREVVAADGRLDAVAMYGSFAQGVGDAYSDVEFWLFTTAEIDPVTWCEDLGPVLAVARNEFGAHVVFFPGLIRGEFHFAPAADIPVVESWADPVVAVLDRHGRLRESIDRAANSIERPTPEDLCLRYANWLVLAVHTHARGETLRTWDTLGHVQRHLLWMARLASGATATWLTPSRRAETELPAALVERLHAVPAGDAATSLRRAWDLGRDLWHELADQHGFAVPGGLAAAIDGAVRR